MTTRFEYPDMVNKAGEYLRVNPTETDAEWAPGGGTGGGPDTRVYTISALLTNTGNRTTYAGLLGSANNNTVEANILTPFHENVVVKKVYFYISGNTCNETCVYTVRKNGVDTAANVSVPAGTTGFFEIDVNESYNTTDTFSIKGSISGTATGSVSMGGASAPGNPGMNVIVEVSGGSPLGVQSVDGDDVDNTDPFNPIVNSVIKKIKVTLTSAQILALHTTPVQLIAAPGAGKAIQILQVKESLVFNTTPYQWNDVSGNNTFGVLIYSQNASLQSSGFPVQQANLFTAFDPAIVLACGILSSSNNAIQLANSLDSNGAVSSISKSSIVENDAILIGSFSTPAGSPQMVNGDSDLDLYITYEVITL